MAGKYREVDLSGVKTVSVSDRGSSVTADRFGRPAKGGKSFARWLDSLPRFLAVEELRALALAMRRAHAGPRGEILWMMGAHVVKCGLSPYVIDLVRRGWITGVAMNGAGAIHDMEIALFGETSEDVAANLERGIFGFASETADAAFDAIAGGERSGYGLGEALGARLVERRAPHRKLSILCEAYRHDVPVTVHVAVGTDILHQHPGFDGATWGRLTARDFRIFAERVRALGVDGGVALNIGSAVLLPEVLLKAFSIARNLGAPFERLTTCTMDMVRHYRPEENVLRRPTAFGGRGIRLVGHHELLVPLLYSALLS